MESERRSDIALLRRFEPTVRYTRGERFFPVDVKPYVESCSLWVQRDDEEPVCLVPEGELTLEKLAEPRPQDFQTVHYLKFIEPLNISQMAAYRLQARKKKRDRKDKFRAGLGRLARVGYVSRFVDTLFSLTLLARGRVSGDTAAAAAMAYEQILEEDERYSYYGRVVRWDGWIVLQYWFFYPFNNWRSGFFGVNDHEGDWEMICVYLSEAADGEVNPEWVAYSSHDLHGDDLRRRWDDDELEKVGEHPVVYAGAGSHAGYFAPGEYLTEIELAFLAPFVRVAERLRKFWERVLRQSRAESSRFNVLRAPFVDYARGDGLSIGPGGEKEWDEPNLLEPVPDWAANYRGLWGLFARDPISGEDAPAGPLYNRDGTMRRSWYDPLGWAGLDKVPPPDEAPTQTAEQRAKLRARCEAVEEEISGKSRQLVELGVETAAMRGHAHLRELHASHEKKIAVLSEEVSALRSRLAADRALIEALDSHERRLRAGERGPAREHIRRAHQPASDEKLRLNVLAEAWAAISIGIAMIGLVALILFAREYLAFGLVALVSLLVFVEAGFRRRLTGLVNSVSVGLAVVAALILLYEFFWTIVVLAALAAGAYMVWENLRELWT